MNNHAGRTANRFFKSMAVSNGDPLGAHGFTDGQRWADANQVKAAVDAMSMGTESALANAVGEDFVEAIYPLTIIGRLAGLRRVPLQTRMIRQTAGATSYWVHESDPKPVAAASFADAGELPPRKVCALSVITQELARHSNAEDIIGVDLQKAAITELDSSFIDPANAGVTGEQPASVTNGLTPISATSDPAADIGSALDAFTGQLESAAWVMHPKTAASLSLRGDPFGFVHALGGQLVGLPVVTSSACPVGVIVLLDQDGIELGGGEGANLKTAREASILMETEPGSGATQLTSLWQTNSMALLAEIVVNWRIARTGAVVVITGVDY